MTRRPTRVIWLLPLAYVVHDAEEYATRQAWLAEHGVTLSRWLRQALGANPVMPIQSMSEAAVLRAMGAIFLLILVVTAAFAVWRSQATRLAYLVVLGGFFVHGFAHVGQAIAFGGYAPGVATALLVVIPASLLIYRQLSKAEPTSIRATLITAAIGALLFVPLVLLAVAIGRA
jgi:hypothetical protein